MKLKLRRRLGRLRLDVYDVLVLAGNSCILSLAISSFMTMTLI